jgi:hypothetical protein
MHLSVAAKRTIDFIKILSRAAGIKMQGNIIALRNQMCDLRNHAVWILVAQQQIGNFCHRFTLAL